VDIAVTGANGLIGRRLLVALAADPAVDRVIALDRVEALVPAGVTIGVVDVRDPGIADRLEGVDVLVHLAFEVDSLRDEEAMRDVNVNGTRTTLAAAVEAGVRRIVVASSASVYGAHPDNDVPLTESSPRRPLRAFAYARHKGEVEDWLWGWAGTLPNDVTVTVLRPAIVAGPAVDNFISRQLELPRYMMVAGHKPPVQIVHVDDVVAAFHHVATQDLPGAFNVASPGWVSLDEALAVLGRRALVVPEEVARGIARWAWRLGLTGAPETQLPYVMHPWVVDVQRLEATGWTATRSNRDGLAELAAAHGSWVRIGRLRVRRDRAAMAAVGVAGLLAATATAMATARARRR
jgi:nucleoside-diphosphate-sugar epimerase